MEGLAPLSGRVADAFAVRWTGFLLPPVSGTYRLGAMGFSSYRRYIDGEAIVEYQGVHHSVTQTKR